MASRKRTEEPDETLGVPARTPQAQEQKMVASAMRLAEKQIREGTASSQVVTHFLKLGSSREELEQMKIRHENELLQVKREAIESQKRVEDLYMQALDAMRSYAGLEPINRDLDDEDQDL